jgi:hypothetical protein
VARMKLEAESFRVPTNVMNDNVLYHSVFSFASARRFRLPLVRLGYFQLSGSKEYFPQARLWTAYG